MSSPKMNAASDANAQSDTQEIDELGFWLSRSIEERIGHVEVLRQRLPGYADAKFERVCKLSYVLRR
jgi:hypothetical protein